MTEAKPVLAGESATCGDDPHKLDWMIDEKPVLAGEREKLSSADIAQKWAADPSSPPWKKKVIQLILAERFLTGNALLEACKTSREGRPVAPALQEKIDCGYGKIQAWLWMLRETASNRASFNNLIETLGFRPGDDEILSLGENDALLEVYGHLAGEFALSALQVREMDNQE